MNYDIVREETGAIVATNAAMPIVSVAVVPGADESARIFHRRFMKFGINGAPGTPGAWLVAELDGVRVYFDGASLVVTRQDINP